MTCKNIPTVKLITKSKPDDLDIIEIDMDKTIKIDSTHVVHSGHNHTSLIEVRECGNLEYFSFYLTTRYDWHLMKDNEDTICLVPTKKIHQVK